MLPDLEARPSPDSIYVVAAVCRKCRIHVEIEINYAFWWGQEPCPNSTHPLHHFVHSHLREGGATNDTVLANANSNLETFGFECSSPTCSASVFVRFRPPRLSDDHIQILTNKALLSRRTEEVINAEPARFEGHKRPTAVDVLFDLRIYLKNSFEHQESKPIKADNKRFPLRFGMEGQACKDVLKFLGFMYDVCFLIFPLTKCWLSEGS